jgi:CMP/dCMP kinase
MISSQTRAKFYKSRSRGEVISPLSKMNKISSQTPSIIAIDGPAASGKSTIGSRLAKALGYLFFDTGVLYRAITWLALQRGTDIHDEAAVTALAEEAQIDVAPASKPDGRSCDVLVNGQDITWETRSRKVDENVSIVSTYRGVRRALSQQQRRIGQRGRIVMVGRDIGTVVLPEADLKIYLDATAEERARRRYDEILARGGKPEYKSILKRVRERDHIDSTRDVAPLKAAEDAVVLDSDQLSEDEVFERVLALVK